MSLVMNYLAVQGSKTSLRDGVELGTMLWIGFGAPLTIIRNAFDPYGTKLVALVDTTALLVVFVAQGVCITYFNS